MGRKFSPMSIPWGRTHVSESEESQMVGSAEAEIMRTALRIILSLIGNMVLRNACFDGWEEILQRREERRTIHRQIE